MHIANYLHIDWESLDDSTAINGKSVALWKKVVECGDKKEMYVNKLIVKQTVVKYVYRRYTEMMRGKEERKFLQLRSRTFGVHLPLCIRNYLF